MSDQPSVKTRQDDGSSVDRSDGESVAGESAVTGASGEGRQRVRTILNPGVLRLHAEIRDVAEEYRHRSEKLEHLNERLFMVTSELRARSEALQLLQRHAVTESSAFSTASAGQLVQAAGRGDDELRDAQIAVDEAQQRAAKLHAMGTDGGRVDTLSSAGVSSESVGVLGLDDTGAANSASSRGGVEGKDAAIQRIATAVFRKFVRSRIAEELLEAMGDMEGEALKKQRIAVEALKAAGIRTEVTAISCVGGAAGRNVMAAVPDDHPPLIFIFLALVALGCPGHRVIRVVCGDKELDNMTFHVPHTYTFNDLLIDACDFWGVPRTRFCLRDPKSQLYIPLHVNVLEELDSLPTSLEPPTYLMVQRADVSLSMVASFEHPNPTMAMEAEEEDFALASKKTDKVQDEHIIPAITDNAELLIKEMFRFVMFLVLFMVVVYLRRNIAEQFYISSGARDLIVNRLHGEYLDQTFPDISRTEELFEWLRGPLADAWFSRSQAGYVAETNLWVGAVRVRQVRVQSDANCEITPDMTAEWQSEAERLGFPESFRFVESCQGPYDPVYASKETYGLGRSADLTFGWQYMDPVAGPIERLASSALGADKVLTSSSVMGDLGTYDAGGFVFELTDGMTRVQWEQALNTYQNWYNPGFNALMYAQLLVEFTDTGFIQATDKIFVFTLDFWEGPQARATAVLYYILVAYSLNVWVRQINGARKHGVFSVFNNVFAFTDFVLYGVILVAFVIRYIALFDVNAVWLGQNLNTKLSMDIGDVANLQSVANGLDATAVALAFFHLFKYFEISHDLDALWLTLKEATSILIYYLMLYFTFFAGFVVITHSVFGIQVRDYSNVVRTIRTLLLALLGEFDYDQVAENSDFWAPTLFITYMIMMKFVLFNLLLAIFNDSYAEVMRRREEEAFTLKKEGKYREKLTFWHVIGVFIPRYSPKERRKLNLGKEDEDESRMQGRDWRAERGEADDVQDLLEQQKRRKMKENRFVTEEKTEPMYEEHSDDEDWH